MIDINYDLKPADLSAKIARMWEVSAAKLLAIETDFPPGSGTPVFTVGGKYQAQGWTEWTQGFQFGSTILQFDATDDRQFLEIGRSATRNRMAHHLTHIGVHDHGFNNVSTFGNLRRLMLEGRLDRDEAELDFWEVALKCSGAVQAARWSNTSDGDGYIYSFNGPHSLFCDTIRSLRSLSLAHRLGQCLMAENDAAISLLDRMIQHARSTARYSVYYGEGRDSYDVRGRVAHESVFNCNDGNFRCPSTQQGYSPFTTWTRGQAWIIAGYPEQLEFLATLNDDDLQDFGGRSAVESMMLEAAKAACDHFISETPSDGIPYWDTGAPGLANLDNHQDQAADPFNDFEPVDSSAAAISVQGLLRLGRYLATSDSDAANKYYQAGLTVLSRLLEEPYLSMDENHQGLLLHSIYHRPRGWDHAPEGSSIPCGEACMWGDYHLREAALYLQRVIRDETYFTFYAGAAS